MKETTLKIFTVAMEFKPEIEISGLGNRAFIHINADDRVSFRKTPVYWSLVYATENAYNELVTYPPRQLSFDEMKYWLDKHADLYQSTSWR